MADLDMSIPSFIDPVVDFPDGASYRLLRPLTDFRVCHDGTPAEARILFTCKQLNQGAGPYSEEPFVIKVKAQTREPGAFPDSGTEPHVGPSTTTASELKALGVFARGNSAYAPHLVAWKSAVQGSNGPFPGGFLTYTVMTTVPGETLFNLQFWTMEPEEREAIIPQFLQALYSIYALGIEPIDRGLRNIVWDRQTKKCSIIDFELWRETKDTIGDELKELQRWGLARAPAARSFFAAFESQIR